MPCADELRCLFDLQRLRGIDDVVRREAVVQPAGGLAVQALCFEDLCDCRREGDDVVLDFGLDFSDASRIDSGFCRDGFGGTGRNHANLGKHSARRRLDLEPAAVLVLFSPDAAHRRAGVALDQGHAPRIGHRLMAVANS